MNIRTWKSSNAFGIDLGKRISVSVFPGIRAAWFGFERQPNWFSVTVAHPRRHAAWAFSLYVHF